MMTGRTDILFKKTSDILEGDILDYWAGMQDPSGGFFEETLADGTPDRNASRDVLRNAHILLAFSMACRRLRKKEYMLPAINAKDYFLEHCIDHKFGGAYYTVDSTGEKLDTRASLYVQAHAILALCAFYSATRDEEALKTALNIHRIIEKEFHDSKNSGYAEALTRDFKPLDSSKIVMSHVHLMESYASLYHVWPDSDLRRETEELMDLIIGRFFNPATGHLIHSCSEDWQEVNEEVSYGSDFETSWILLDSAYTIMDIDCVNKVKGIAARLAKAGMEGYREDGSVFCPERGTTPMWVQEESVVANLCAWKYQNDFEGADNALRTWKFLCEHPVIDGDHLHDHPYHGTNMCIQILSLFR